MAQIQFSLIKKIRIGPPEHSLASHPTTSDNTSFLSCPPPPPPPLNWTSYVYHPLPVLRLPFGLETTSEINHCRKLQSGHKQLLKQMLCGDI